MIVNLNKILFKSGLPENQKSGGNRNTLLKLPGMYCSIGMEQFLVHTEPSLIQIDEAGNSNQLSCYLYNIF